jgi:hypothetical protein
LKVPLTALQQLIHEILDPQVLQVRSVKEWRRLYKSFFAIFAPDGCADETEKRAWAIATGVFNTNLVAVANRTTQVVPMTYQDFVDGVDSFRHDGLREGAQRDIVWQPKKILLLMASMVGRIVAGWQADVEVEREPRPDVSDFRSYLITANRNASYLGSVFDYDPRFSVLDYGTAGLKPLLKAFPHFAHGLLENDLSRCEVCPPQGARTPPLLRAHFQRPLRVPWSRESLSTLHLVLIHQTASINDNGNRNPGSDDSCFESSKAILEALAFESSEAPAAKCFKTEGLFELSLTGGLIVCGPHRADASSADRIGRTLGRTPEEQFVIERFLALGFKSGHGNEPWLERPANGQPELACDKIKKARKQFARWKKTSLFFIQAGHAQTKDIPGASIRQEALQSDNESPFLSLLHAPAYAPLMATFLEVDAHGNWVVGLPELHAFARKLSGGVGKILSETGTVIARCAKSFKNRDGQAVFLFECAFGILLSACGGHKGQKCPAGLEGAKSTLREHYERSFGVSLSEAPTVLQANRCECEARLAETKTQLEQAEQTVIGLLAEPLTNKISALMRATLATIPTVWTSLAEQTAPRVRFDSREVFEGSVNELCAWLKTALPRGPDDGSLSARQFLAACIGFRELAEQEKTEEALASLSALYPTLSETRQHALAPFLGELAWSLLQAIEQQCQTGNITNATRLAARATALVEATPFSEDFKNMFQTLFTPQPVQKADPLPQLVIGASPSDPNGTRAREADLLLRNYAEELNLAENQLERAFLQAVRDGSETGFRRRDKLNNRLKRRTRWGGREPYRTLLRLLESIRKDP